MFCGLSTPDDANKVLFRKKCIHAFRTFHTADAPPLAVQTGLSLALPLVGQHHNSSWSTSGQYLPRMHGHRTPFFRVTSLHQGAGRQLNGELVAAKALAKAQKEGVREHAASVNALKKRIDQLQVRKGKRTQGEDTEFFL